MLYFKSILTLAMFLGGFQTSAAVFKGRVTLEDLNLISEEAISSENLHQLLASDKSKATGMNRPDWVTDGNRPDWYTNGNRPDWMTDANRPDWVTDGNRPDWYTHGRPTGSAKDLADELPSPTIGLQE